MTRCKADTVRRPRFSALVDLVVPPGGLGARCHVQLFTPYGMKPQRGQGQNNANRSVFGGALQLSGKTAGRLRRAIKAPCLSKQTSTN